MTRKNPAGNGAGVRDRAVAAAQQAVPTAKNAIPKAAQQAGPLAKNAGTAIRQSAEDAAAWARPRAEEVAAWARPHVDDARAWAAPRLERSGVAVQESIAPAISDAMITAARNPVTLMAIVAADMFIFERFVHFGKNDQGLFLDGNRRQ